jgi:transposase
MLYAKPGATISSLAKNYGVSQPTVRKWLIDYQIHRKSHKEASQQANKRDAVCKPSKKDFLAVCNKMSINQLQTYFKTNQKTIYQWFEDFGIQQTDSGYRKKIINENNFSENYCTKQIRTLWSECLNIEQFAEKLDVSYSFARKVLKANQLKAKFVKVSKPVVDIVEDIRTYYQGPVETNNRTVLDKGYELDIFLPEKNIAIEFHGLYHHVFRPGLSSPAQRKDQSYHINKLKGCQDKQIHLMQFFSDEWEEKRSIVLSMIRSKIGSTTKIYAKQCQVVMIDKEKKKQFLKDNHIQGNDNSSKYFGLTHEGKLVAVMTFCPIRFKSKTYTADWELSRFACLQNHTIVGGFSKLLHHSEYNGITGTIVSYADRRWSNGNVYLKNNFVLRKTNPPAYYYVKNGEWTKRYSRMMFQKKMINAKEGQTEFDRMQELGYSKIFDCGTLSFVLNTGNK